MSATDALPGLVQQRLAVFLDEAARGWRQQVEHQFGRTAQARAERGLDKWPVDQDRMREHCAQQCSVVQGRIVETQLQIWRSFLADGLANRDAGSGDKRLQRLAAWRMLQVVDDLRFDPGMTNQREGVAGRPAAGVVVNDGVHGGLVQG